MPWKINADFAAAETKIKTGAKAVERTVAEQVKQRAQALAPVKSGRLRDSARVVETTTEDGESAVSVVFDAPYAEAVHNGHMEQGEDGNSTGFRVPRPFLRDALDASQEELDQAAAKVAREVAKG